MRNDEVIVRGCEFASSRRWELMVCPFFFFLFFLPPPLACIRCVVIEKGDESGLHIV